MSVYCSECLRTLDRCGCGPWPTAAPEVSPETDLDLLRGELDAARAEIERLRAELETLIKACKPIVHRYVIRPDAP